ncbi:MAG: 50S ribosomal protein L2 [Candidatus Diapherotrites archaeon]|nr:50S ribosomal protein L2 [Candidatus Diapherotrites archaeon]
MGRRIIARRRGKGSIFTATKRAKVDTKYLPLNEEENNYKIGEVTQLLDDRGKNVVIAEIDFDGVKEYLPAAEGLYVGQKIKQGQNADLEIGNILPLAKIPEGCPIFNIEATPNDGGKFARSSGSYGLIMSKDENFAYVKLPSGKQHTLDLRCRATIGCASCGSRIEKPFVKAGKKYHAIKSKGGKRYPIVRGVAMNPVSHPHGGSQHHVGRSKSVSRNAPPGAKVGAIASRRTGRKKR